MSSKSVARKFTQPDAGILKRGAIEFSRFLFLFIMEKKKEKCVATQSPAPKVHSFNLSGQILALT
ncbi:MAG: hypothetical protein R2730_09795 [Chitinophagales bacterium]